MKCPDCQGALEQVSLTGFDESYRCRACGGFWMQSWVVNKVVMEDVSQWSRLGMKADPTLKTGKCPKDGSDLTGVDPTQVPDRVNANKCDKCGWWWFPGDNLFDFRTAQQAKVNYFKWWGKSGDLAKIILPAVMVIVLVAGLGVGLSAVRKRQSSGVSAKTPITEFSSQYMGEGTAVVSFMSEQAVNEVAYSAKNSGMWTASGVTRQNGKYYARISGLYEGAIYLVRIGDSEYGFIAE